MDKNPSTILIVDDEQAMRKALGELLIEEGYEVEFAENGTEAMTKAESIPDLILLDVMLPDMDGLTVCRNLRADKLLAQVPIIMITSLGDRASRLQGFEAGADDYVSKPIDEPELLARVKTTTHLNRYRKLLEEQLGREMAEEALQISEARYRQLFDRVPVGLYRSTPDRETLDANRALVEMLGYPDAETLLASNAVELYVDPQDHQRWQAMMEQEGTVRGFETQWKRQDGTPIWIQESARLIRDEKGEVLYYEGAVEDITERRQAEEELRESAEKHRMLFETMTQGVLYWDAEGQVSAANPAAERILGLTLDQLQGQAPIDPRWKLIRQDGTEVLGEALPAIAALRSGEEIHGVTFRFFNSVLDSYHWVSVNAMPLFRPGEDTAYSVHTILEDITERVQAEAEIKQHNQELTMLNEIGQAIVSTLDLQETLTIIADHTTRLMGMAATSVILIDEANDDLYFAAASGEGEGFIVGQRLALDQGVAGWVVQHGEPVLVPDVTQDDRWYSGFDAEGGFSTRSILCVPLKSKGRVIGALEAINKEYGFSQDDLHLLNALAAPVSTAIENARLFQQVHTGREQLQTLSRYLVEVQEAERAHVARELHDETSQALSSMLLNLGLLEQEADRPERVISRTKEMIVIVDDMLENLHRLAMNLRPATLDHLGLIPTLEQYIETFNQQYNIKTRFEAVGLGKERLPPEVETALYRIVQESLTNIARHARATRADVLVERRGDQVVTIIEDNGVGFEPRTTARPSRLGLLGMRERAEMLGGSLVIESAPESGTTVFVEVPYGKTATQS